MPLHCRPHTFDSVGGTLLKEVEKLEESVLEMMQRMVVGMAGPGHTPLPVAMESLSLPGCQDSSPSELSKIKSSASVTV